MRQVLLVVLCVVSLGRSALTFSQEVPAAPQAAPEVQLAEEDESLKAYQFPNRIRAETAARWIMVLIYGTVAIVLIMFLLLAYFHEPSQASKPYSPTKVIRAKDFVPTRREREERSERINLDQELSD